MPKSVWCNKKENIPARDPDKCTCKGSGLAPCVSCCERKNQIRCKAKKALGKPCKRTNDCKTACKGLYNKYAPEPSSQYELDSFEIGTEPAICEDCGEIHGLDEYEEMGKGANVTGQTQTYNNKNKLTQKQMQANMEEYKRTKNDRRNKYGGKAMYYRDKDGNMRFCSEPIPDYIMRALKPKKSVHPEYGKLRY